MARSSAREFEHQQLAAWTQHTEHRAQRGRLVGDVAQSNPIVPQSKLLPRKGSSSAFASA